MKKNIADTVRDLAQPLADEFGYILWDVEYVREGADMVLVITIDTDDENGITYVEDGVDGAYLLSVSSPGVERVLTRPEHFERMAGEDVVMKFYTAVDGSKTLRATLIGLREGENGDEIVVSVNGEERAFPKKSVAKCETVFDW